MYLPIRDSIRPETDGPAGARQSKPAPGSLLELLFNEREAMLSLNGKQLLYFQSPVKVSGEEILDWMNQGLISELISIEDIPAREGVSITLKELAPVYAGKTIVPEQSSRSLLLNPQWFSVYFIVFSAPQPEPETNVLADETSFRGIRVKLHAFFESGKALTDYKNRKIYLSRLLLRPAA